MTVTLTPTNNGPTHVQGPVTIKTEGGQTINVTEEAWLCRCGHSSNKPFCDGTHEKIGFESDLDQERSGAPTTASQ